MSVAKSCILQYFTRVRITKNFIIFENQVKHKFRVKEYLIQQIDYLLVLTVTQGRTMYNMIKHLCSIQQNDTQKYLNKKLGEILLLSTLVLIIIGSSKYWFWWLKQKIL